MSAPRTVTIVTADHGPVAIPEPAWCAGEHADGEYRVNIRHEGAEMALTLPTRRGPVVYLTAALEARPFAADLFLRRPCVSIGIDGDHYPMGLAGLERMAAELEMHAEQLRDRARELAVALAEGGAR